MFANFTKFVKQFKSKRELHNTLYKWLIYHFCCSIRRSCNDCEYGRERVKHLREEVQSNDPKSD